MRIHFTVRGKPTAQARHRTFRMKTKGGKEFNINTDPHKQKKNDFLAIAHANAPDVPLTGPLFMAIKAVFPRPKNHYRTGARSDELKDTAPFFCASKGRNDWDNLGKFICDALNGIFYEDDGQICMGGPVLKIYGDVPRTEVVITTLDEVEEFFRETWKIFDKPQESRISVNPDDNSNFVERKTPCQETLFSPS